MKAKNGLLLLALLFFLAGTATAEVVVIANSNVVDTTLSKNNLGEIFLGKKIMWSDNVRINFVLSQESPLHQTFLKSYVRRSAIQFQMHWRNMVFTGRGSIPRTLDSDSEVIDFVSNTNGAVGYVNTVPKVANVKILTIN